MKNEEILAYWNELFPDARCELNYTTDYGLLIAVMLSAQTTDKRVNEVIRKLFSHFPTLDSLQNASIEEISEDIKSLGLTKNKAKNVIGIATRLCNEFNNLVPSKKEKLLTLPGVGVKTANVVRAELFQIPEFGVDTHVERIAKRLGYAGELDNVTIVERKLKEGFLPSQYIKTHHQMIHFGRYFCKAVKPQCEGCKIKQYCLLKR